MTENEEGTEQEEEEEEEEGKSKRIKNAKIMHGWVGLLYIWKTAVVCLHQLATEDLRLSLVNTSRPS